MYVYFVCLLFINFLFLTVKSGIFVINTNENVVDSGGEVYSNYLIYYLIVQTNKMNEGEHAAS